MKHRTNHRNNGFWRHTGMAVMMGLSLHLTSATAWAQRSGSVPGEDKGWIQWLVALGLAAIMLGIAFKNAKRSHLD